MKNKKNLVELEEKLGFKFTDQKLLQQIFIHRSYLNEIKGGDLAHNERLEFLGDAVLELVVTEHLYETYDNPEGELTNWRSAIVRGEILAETANELGLGDYLMLSRGEEKSGGRNRNLILANTFEALIGGIYLDAGYEAAGQFIHKHLIAKLPNIIAHQLHIDPKSKLQEISQDRFSRTPEYKTLKEEGPDHAKTFEVGVYVNKKLLAKGSGSSKQRAEQNAAANALKKLTKAT